MDFGAIGQFLTGTYAGLGISVAACLVISIIAAAVLEAKTRKRFVNHEKRQHEPGTGLIGYFTDDEQEEDSDSSK